MRTWGRILVTAALLAGGADAQQAPGAAPPRATGEAARAAPRDSGFDPAAYVQ